MVTIIAAVARNGIIGKDNDLPWYIPEDLKRFQELTAGHPIIMGWKTFLSILQRTQERSRTAKLLPNRTHFVLTSKSPEEIKQILDDQYPNFDLAGANSSLVFCKSIGNAIQRAEAMNPQVFVIGGQRAFKEALDVAAKMELTEIHEDYQGDVYFPQFEANHWVKHEEPHERFSFTTYTRRRN